tara:strand:- start:511 stop:921 length:411 start_codon:yes stop_codon:yes gene_type:complete
MKNIKFIYFFGLITFLFTKPTPTTLEDYAYDFSTIGYEIVFPATSGYFDAMNAGDYFNAKDKGYTIKVRIESLSRNSRREFVSYYNENCKYDFMNDTCPITVSGEVELDESMGMILTAKKIDFYDSERTTIIKSFE